MIDYYLDDYCEKTPEDFGYVHQDQIPSIERIQDNLKVLMQCMYGSGDVAMMESCLDEICDEVGMKINPGTPVIEKKQQSDTLTWYLGYQRALIDFQNKTQRKVV
jgi:hypothetical protein